jgi:hypothetical protein
MDPFSWLPTLLMPGQAVELRGLAVGTAKALSRTFAADQAGLAALAAQAHAWDAQGARGVYWTPNPLRADLADGSSARDADVVARRWLLIDVDPVRPADLPSSDAEKMACWVVADRVRRALVAADWPEPVLADSGNGWHLLLPIEARNDEASKQMCKAFLAELSSRLSTASAKIDTSVYNAARIVRCYGTTTRKGVATAERPHRRSRYIGRRHFGASAPEQTTPEEHRRGWRALQGMLSQWRAAEAMAGGHATSSTAAYAESALKAECRNVERAADGERNNTLNRAAFALAQLAAGGHLDHGRAVSALTQAAKSCGLPDAEIETTLASAFAAGGKEPRAVPPAKTGKAQPASAGKEDADGEPDLRSYSGEDEPLPAMLTAAELLTMDFPEQPCVVAGMIPIGLTMVAARPKTGKSWLVTQLCIAVATGQQVLDRQAVQGNALYLALEDHPRRCKSRLEILLGQAPYPEGMDRLAYLFSDVKRGDLRPIESWLKTAEAPRLVVIDTLGRFLPARGRQDSGDAYQADYAFMGDLKSLADQNNLAILIVHHTRKADADDPLTEVSGSTAYTGAADAVLVLHRSRSDADASLTITGRDFEEGRLDVQMEGCAWRLGGGGFQSGAKRAKPDRLESATQFLREALAAGPRQIVELRRMTEVLPEPISSSALYRAKKDIRCEEYVEAGRKWWRLPAASETDTIPL